VIKLAYLTKREVGHSKSANLHQRCVNIILCVDQVAAHATISYYRQSCLCYDAILRN